MPNKNAESVCDLCLDVISGLCTEEQRLAFERHLPGCEACQAEIEELRIVWEALPADMEQIEPPEDLKQQVMDAAFAAESVMTAEAAAARKRAAMRRRIYRSTAVAALFLFIAGTSWNVWLYKERTGSVATVEEALNVPAAQIEQVVALGAQPGAAKGAYGVACIVNNGQSKQFVVYVFGAAPTSGDEAYQVWLIKDGERKSAGTFRVGEDAKGIGLLALPMGSDHLAFDSIGITLEPDDQGDQPRGEKKFGSA
ncbi:anti-sigma factor [Paenibacillus mendelii]|uniref:Regulator of SigK n=1 Tax=Paenibacillus mendelii TaxID=206163 RepID=A0ABV6J9D7_9BACL|nr:anti-sigma factor [Paenibacillus mendelii]MCQ6559491.1 anti-sigma factor [Paenibacillus mendelii]